MLRAVQQPCPVPAPRPPCPQACGERGVFWWAVLSTSVAALALGALWGKR